MKLQALTNVRPTKDLGSEVILSPTEGQFKITPDAAKTLQVSNGDYVGVVNDANSGEAYVFKGSADTLGAKAASANKGGGGILTFSAAAGWAELGGDVNFNTHFTMADEPKELSDEEVEALADTPFAGVDLFPIVYREKIAKTPRKSKKADASDDADEVEAVESISAQSSNSFDDL